MNEQERLIIAIDAQLNALNSAIEEKLKPALREAVADVLTEFLDDLAASAISVSEGSAV